MKPFIHPCTYCPWSITFAASNGLKLNMLYEDGCGRALGKSSQAGVPKAFKQWYPLHCENTATVFDSCFWSTLEPHGLTLAAVINTWTTSFVLVFYFQSSLKYRKWDIFARKFKSIAKITFVGILLCEKKKKQIKEKKNYLSRKSEVNGYFATIITV